ncbi:MAG: mechanosensitive ion channel [Chloroflexi bacterium]|nr:mechanosensitive ion channel [Chloroflexota bacterium]
MVIRNYRTRKLVTMLVWSAIAGAALLIERLWASQPLLGSGLSPLRVVAMVAGVLAIFEAFDLLTALRFRHQRKPEVESKMVGSLYRLAAMLVALLAIAYGFGALQSVSNFFSLFGGMLLGWSLQAPVSGFAAWALVSAIRPFRPGDRVQFPTLGLVGDVMSVSALYTVLNQVGGSIGSEEAVGRHIMVPNAMLFSQVVINYTVTQEAAYMLDEVVIRITYDSNWETAERLLLEAAHEVTADVIAATNVEPYIRCDWYDYGVYMRLRYQTQVQERANTAYKIQKLIFQAMQHAPDVDLAIPYVYSSRAGAELRDQPHAGTVGDVRDIEIAQLHCEPPQADTRDIEQLAASIQAQGLLQPIVVVPRPQGDGYDVVAGHLRLAACRKLNWISIPALIQHTAGPAQQPK